MPSPVSHGDDYFTNSVAVQDCVCKNDNFMQYKQPLWAGSFYTCSICKLQKLRIIIYCKASQLTRPDRNFGTGQSITFQSHDL